MRGWLFALRIGRIPHLTHRVRLCHQSLEVVHEPLSAVLGILVVPPDVDRFLGAHLLAVAAEDAAELVDLEDQRVAVALLVLTRDELDAVRGTYGGTQPARDALRLARFGGEHAMRAAPPLRDRFLLLRVLRGHLVGVDKMLEGLDHPLQRRPYVTDLFDRSIEHFHVDRHQSPDWGLRGARAAATAWSRASCCGVARPYAGLMMRPRSRITNAMKTSTRFTAVRIRP